MDWFGQEVTGVINRTYSPSERVNVAHGAYSRTMRISLYFLDILSPTCLPATRRQERCEILLSDPNGGPETMVAERAVPHPTADGLVGNTELIGDLMDGETGRELEALGGHRVSLV